jgi:hypothetical protein
VRHALSMTLRGPIIQIVNPESQALVDGFALSLRADNKAPRTVETYTEAVSQFANWLTETGGPALVDADRIPGLPRHATRCRAQGRATLHLETERRARRPPG